MVPAQAYRSIRWSKTQTNSYFVLTWFLKGAEHFTGEKRTGFLRRQREVEGSEEVPLSGRGPASPKGWKETFAFSDVEQSSKQLQVITLMVKIVRGCLKPAWWYERWATALPSWWQSITKKHAESLVTVTLPGWEPGHCDAARFSLSLVTLIISAPIIRVLSHALVLCGCLGFSWERN